MTTCLTADLPSCYAEAAIAWGAVADSPYAGPERRATPRYRVNFPARWSGHQAEREGTVTDISTTGCFMLSEDLVTPGEVVRIEIGLRAGGRITLWGRVVYRAEEIGFGVRFAPFLHEDDRKRLGWLVRAEEQRSRRTLISRPA